MKQIRPTEFTSVQLQKLKELERIAYEGTHLSMMQHCSSWASVADYCDCELSELNAYIFDTWYLLLAVHDTYIEIVDLASSSTHTPLFKVLEIIEQYEKPFLMDCRETTSYRMIQALEKAGRIHIETDESYQRDGETFHEIEASLQKRTKSFAR